MSSLPHLRASVSVTRRGCFQRNEKSEIAALMRESRKEFKFLGEDLKTAEKNWNGWRDWSHGKGRRKTQSACRNQSIVSRFEERRKQQKINKRATVLVINKENNKLFFSIFLFSEPFAEWAREKPRTGIKIHKVMSDIKNVNNMKETHLRPSCLPWHRMFCIKTDIMGLHRASRWLAPEKQNEIEVKLLKNSVQARNDQKPFSRRTCEWTSWMFDYKYIF